MMTTIQCAIRRALFGTMLLAGFILIVLLTPQDAPFASNPAAFAQGPEAEDAAPLITVDLSQTRGKIDGHAFGVIMTNKGNDITEQNYFYRTAPGQQNLRELGVRALFYWVDRDDWEHPYSSYTAAPVTPPSLMLTDEFLTLNNIVGSEPMISVNITMLCHQTDPNAAPSSANVSCGKVTPQTAKDWLNYIKQTGIRSVKYVQLGAEPYAGCHYWDDPAGINCTTAKGEHKIQLTQDEYAKRVAQWAKAIHQVDPKIKVGVHLLPNAFICKTDCNKVSWDETLLKKAGSHIDFVITHQYFQVDNPVTDPATAQKFSYYQEQVDIRKRNEGLTAMPSQIRSELLKWLPAKKNMPIVIGEFNAARVGANDDTFSINTRMSLFAGFSIAEGYLDAVAPVNLNGVLYPGAARVILLDLYTLPVMISHFLPLDNPTTLVTSPSWRMLAALKDFQGKTWTTTSVKNNPQTPVGRPALRVYAVKKGKNVWLAVFNHSTTTTYTVKVKFVGTTLVSGNKTVIGDTAASFLTQNTTDAPNAVGPTTTQIPAAQIKKSTLSGMVFPAHSLTMSQLTGK
ncbi:MAG: hypothetical protein HY741_03920 [Chloroflexi bacterium]|nr:hypothetical protein [Chloroflexota bacterium]